MNHTLLDAHGEIAGVLTTSDPEAVELNTPPGGSSVEGLPPDWNSYYAGGGWVPKGEPPVGAPNWNPVAKAWVDLRPLEEAQAAQLAALADAYQSAIAQAVSFTTSAGVAQTFQADPESISNCTASMLGCQAALATPDGFYWVAADNAHVPFTYADLRGLAAAFFAQGSAAFAKLQTLKGRVRAAATVADVVAVTW